MIKFVNAKINIGLQIVNRREDGYHDLQTLFYPVGKYAGTPLNPVEFCDVLEVTACRECDAPFRFGTTGRNVDCPTERNLVYRAAGLMCERGLPEGFTPCVTLDKHLPDGAGMGGGSADAAFTLRAIAEAADAYAVAQGISWNAPSGAELADMALRLGADCPFFLLNAPAYAEGVGERLESVELDLSGHWLVVIKPAISISTREAFAGVTPRKSEFDLRTLPSIPLTEWRRLVRNDFEDSIFPSHPEFPMIKQTLYDLGALYASLTGSGSCIYGIFPDSASARNAVEEIKMIPTIKATYLLKL